MLVYISGSFGSYQVSINNNAELWHWDFPCPLAGAKMASILHRIVSNDIIYVGF
jgi:hypothetical protein